jgi:hypothetical protein
MGILGGVGILLFLVGAAAIDSEGIGLLIAIAMMVAGMALCTISIDSMVEPDDDVDDLIRKENKK